MILTDAPPLGAPTLRFQPAAWPGAYHQVAAQDGVHGLLRMSGADHRLWMPYAITPGAAVACVLPLGPGASWSASAVVRFWRHVSQGRAPEVRFDARLRRAQMSLLALDRRDAGASYRSVAELVYGAGRVAAESWRTSSLRDATIRLVRSGAAFVAGDYRRLLRTPSEE